MGLFNKENLKKAAELFIDANQKSYDEVLDKREKLSSEKRTMLNKQYDERMERINDMKPGWQKYQEKKRIDKIQRKNSSKLDKFDRDTDDMKRRKIW